MTAKEFLESRGFVPNDYYGDNLGYVRRVAKDSPDEIKVRCFKNSIFIFCVEYKHNGISSSDMSSSVVFDHISDLEKLDYFLKAFGI